MEAPSTKLNIALSCVAPDQYQMSFRVSDGAFSKPPMALLDYPQSNKTGSRRWLAVQPDSVVERKWLKALGQGLASYFSIAPRRATFTLAELPLGYQLFEYVNKSEHTHYLFGYPTRSKVTLKFKTASEFLPHLIWLASQAERKCLCKFCQTQPPCHGSTFRVKDVPTSYSIRDNENLTSGYQDSHPKETISNYRSLELVWCELDLKSLNVPLDSKYWPGICQSTQVALEACEILDLSTDQEDSLESRRVLAARERRDHENNTSIPTAWESKKEVRKKHYWQIQLLGVSDLVCRSESHILPWLYRAFDEPVWRAVTTGKLAIPDYLLDPKKPVSTLSSLSNPVTARLAFQLALQIGAEIEESWAPAESPEGLESPIPLNPTNLKKSQPPLSNNLGLWTPCTSLWLGAEKVCAGDLVRLKMLTSQVFPPPAATGFDESILPVLFFQINFFWKPRRSGSAIIVGGRVFELEQLSEALEEPIIIKPPTRNDWLRLGAEKAPRLTLMNNCFDELPPPPKGFRFSKITPDHHIHYIELDCIAGRYYSPKIPHSRLSRLRYQFSPYNYRPGSPRVQLDPAKLKELTSLLGFGNGQENFMKVIKMKASRHEIVAEATRISKTMMSSHFRPKPSPTKKQ